MSTIQQDVLTLNIVEIFSSVQGETSLTGFPTLFIRLAACNLRCTWCDTPYSFGRGTPMAVEAIIGRAHAAGLRHVCVTGGEPLLQKGVFCLITELCNLGFIVSVETGGSLPTASIDVRAKTILDIKCPGSGMSEKNHWENLEVLREQDEVKFVIADRADYLWAIDVCRRHSLFARGHPPLFSPVHGMLNPQQLVAWILEDNIPVRLNVQIHKYIWTPETRGV